VAGALVAVIETTEHLWFETRQRPRLGAAGGRHADGVAAIVDAALVCTRTGLVLA
jgi:hypothetical protein